MNKTYIEDFDVISKEAKKRIKEADSVLSIVSTYNQNLSNFIFDNEYTNILGSFSDYLLDHLFGIDLADHLRWYLYEYDDEEMTISSKDKEYTIACHEDFINATKELFGLENKPDD